MPDAGKKVLLHLICESGANCVKLTCAGFQYFIELRDVDSTKDVITRLLQVCSTDADEIGLGKTGTNHG